MTYNGRAVMAEVAAANGWSVLELLKLADLNDVVLYEQDADIIAITWSAQNTATYIGRSINGGEYDSSEFRGAMGLINVRQIMEAGAARRIHAIKQTFANDVRDDGA